MAGFFQNAFQGVGEFASDALGIAGTIFNSREENKARVAEAQASAGVLNLQTMMQNQQFQLMVLGGGALLAFMLLKKR